MNPPVSSYLLAMAETSTSGARLSPFVGMTCVHYETREGREVSVRGESERERERDGWRDGWREVEREGGR